MVARYLWIILIVVIVLLLVNPRSNARNVIEALSNQVINNVKALQGNVPSEASLR